MKRAKAFALCALLIASIGVLDRVEQPESAPPGDTTVAVRQLQGPRPVAVAVAGAAPALSASKLKDETLSSQLVQLAGAAQHAQASGVSPLDAARSQPALSNEIDAGRMRIDNVGDVQVYVETAANVATAEQQLAAAGAHVELSDSKAGIVQARVPVESLKQVAALPGVTEVRLPDYPVLSAGSVMTEGDPVVNADVVRNSIPGADGTGVTVGVISDGVAGLQEAQTAGELPFVDTSTCNVGGADLTTGAEGTAMLEIVHDVAPNASLIFGNFGLASGLAFNDAVNCLAQHADVIVDDIGFFGAGPYDGSSVYSQNTANALNGSGRVRAYITAVGNQAGRHYQSRFIDSGFLISSGGDIWSANEFDDANADYPVEHAGLVGAPANFDRFRLSPGGSATITLVWDDPWNASSNNYDLFFSDGAAVEPCSLGVQDGNDHPTESCTVRNQSSSVRSIDVFIANHRGEAQSRVLDLFLLCTGCQPLGNGNTLDFDTPGSSVGNQSDAGGSPVSVIGVGAVRFNSPTGIERFSGRGPTEDGRTKPDVVAPDNVCTSGAGDFNLTAAACESVGRRFLGTSAAAPHVAGIAALLLSCNPTLTRAQLRHAVVDTAVDLGDSGPDQTYGWGRVDALAGALDAGYCGAATPTPSATPTVTSTPTVTDTPTITPTPSNTPTPTVTPRLLIGDANCDSSINAIDAALILQLGAGFLSRLPCQNNADTNVSGSVNSIDAALILQFAAGLIARLPP